jgi:hypothetical protein
MKKMPQPNQVFLNVTIIIFLKTMKRNKKKISIYIHCLDQILVCLLIINKEIKIEALKIILIALSKCLAQVCLEWNIKDLLEVCSKWQGMFMILLTKINSLRLKSKEINTAFYKFPDQMLSMVCKEEIMTSK